MPESPVTQTTLPPPVRGSEGAVSRMPSSSSRPTRARALLAFGLTDGTRPPSTELGLDRLPAGASPTPATEPGCPTPGCAGPNRAPGQARQPGVGGLTVGAKGVRLTAGPIESQDEELPAPLPQRFLRHQRLQFGDGGTVLTPGQSALDDIFLGGLPTMLSPLRALLCAGSCVKGQVWADKGMGRAVFWIGRRRRRRRRPCTLMYNPVQSGRDLDCCERSESIAARTSRPRRGRRRSHHHPSRSPGRGARPARHLAGPPSGPGARSVGQGPGVARGRQTVTVTYRSGLDRIPSRRVGRRSSQGTP